MYPFNLPLFGPCINTHTELQAGLILKPEPGSNPGQARHLFLKPDLGLKAKLTEVVKVCTTAE